MRRLLNAKRLGKPMRNAREAAKCKWIQAKSWRAANPRNSAAIARDSAEGNAKAAVMGNAMGSVQPSMQWAAVPVNAMDNAWEAAMQYATPIAMEHGRRPNAKAMCKVLRRTRNARPVAARTRAFARAARRAR